MKLLLTSCEGLIRFTIVGVFGAAIYLLGTKALHKYTGLSVSVAATVLFVVVVVVNYLLHYSWSFRSRRPHGWTAPRFLGVAIGAVMINYTIVTAGTHWFRAPQTLVLVVAGIAVVAWNYLMSRFWVFVDQRDHIAASTPVTTVTASNSDIESLN